MVLAFVTVGSTQFDPLVEKVCTQEVVTALQEKGYTEMIVQYGKSDSYFVPPAADSTGLKISGFDYKSDLTAIYDSADLVISHAGSGSIINALRRGKRLIVVVNENLMDNHQGELAQELSAQNYLIHSTIDSLPYSVRGLNALKLSPFPQQNTSSIKAVLESL